MKPSLLLLVLMHILILSLFAASGPFEVENPSSPQRMRLHRLHRPVYSITCAGLRDVSFVPSSRPDIAFVSSPIPGYPDIYLLLKKKSREHVSRFVKYRCCQTTPTQSKYWQEERAKRHQQQAKKTKKHKTRRIRPRRQVLSRSPRHSPVLAAWSIP